VTIVDSLYQCYTGRHVIFDITDTSTINSAVIGLSGDRISNSFFLKIDGKIPDGIQDFWNINKAFLSKITSGILKVAAHKISGSTVYRKYFKQNSDTRLA
jgi:hypothetical protein